MPKVSITNLVEMVRSLEQLGDNAVITPLGDGKMGTQDVSVNNTAQAKADELFVRDVISTLRNTAGIGRSQIDLAERGFGDILAAGQPLSGREVAAVLKTAVYNLQMELAPNEAMKVLEDFAAAFDAGPLHTLDDRAFPLGLVHVNKQQVREFVEEHITTETVPPPSPPQTAATAKMDEISQDLSTFKTQFGGTPHFPDGKPSYSAASRKFLGIPLESCQAWCQKRIDNASSIFKPFWKLVGKLFGVSDTPQTTYERVALYVESMKLLATHRDSIAEAFRRAPAEGTALMGTLTRLACHVGDNGGPEGMIRNIDAGLEMFVAQYEHAKQRGDLIAFFNVLDGVCFENRMDNLQAYAMAHMEGDNEVGAEEGGLKVKLEHTPAHDAKDDISDAVLKEMGALRSSNLNVTIDWDNGYRPHLIKTLVGMERQAVTVHDGMIEKVFKDGNPLRKEITAEDIDLLRGPLNDILCFED